MPQNEQSFDGQNIIRIRSEVYDILRAYAVIEGVISQHGWKGGDLKALRDFVDASFNELGRRRDVETNAFEEKMRDLLLHYRIGHENASMEYLLRDLESVLIRYGTLVGALRAVGRGEIAERINAMVDNALYPPDKE